MVLDVLAARVAIFWIDCSSLARLHTVPDVMKFAAADVSLLPKGV